MAPTAPATLTMPADHAARLADAELRVPAGTAAAPIRGASIDTRTLRPGDLFAPLPGAHVDGHRFLDVAFARGAAAALCTRAHAATLAGGEPGPLLLVDDVTAALQAIARGWRAAWRGTLIAGKGHEKYQVIGDKTLAFDDVDVARAALARRRSGSRVT